jgi:hypothetical protein
MQKFSKIFDIRTGIMGFNYWKMEPYIYDEKKGKKLKKRSHGNFL